ncbi:MAG TPA: sigma 54-interacting transcriptional regulator [Thermoanaerobaculia bacterium]|nr:sigma 54-interacting transcriptional regulator [Thermoanaerobaculia bacterium]
MTVVCDDETVTAAMTAVSAVFNSVGRGLICLDAEFNVVHASAIVERAAASPAAAMIGHPVGDLLGEELFGPNGTLRELVERGEMREGWRAAMRTGDGSARIVSITAAPFTADDLGICDRRVKFIIVLRPTEEDPLSGTNAPTVFFGMIARSTAMARIFALVQNLQSTDATVLLTGDSGTGKEVLARAIHANSTRRHGRFLAVNCAALPGELLEAELFGHVRGAFTGAVRDRVGRFELANGGTLFLDEIGDMPLHLQAKLLRVLQERTFERVGESVPRSTDARIVAATNVDLRRAIAEGRFREDLYYRLRVVPIELPPLRERREDIEPLARYLLSRVAAHHGREVRFSPDAIRAMLRYPWPGNVRELENAIEYAVAVVRGQTIHAEDLPLEVNEAPAAAAVARGDDPNLRAALDAHKWNREETARALGMSRTTLWRKMREAGLAG